MNNFHLPVLLQETIDALNIKKGEKYIDATLGGGGHTEKILELGGTVLGIDADQDSIDYIKEKIKNQKSKVKIWERLTLAKGNFRNIDKIAHLNGFDPPAGGVRGIIFDLGVSSHQLETANRGFSFQKDGPLDMRMDQELGVRAMDLIKILTKGDLYEIFTKFGEENRAWAISERIVSARKMKPIKTTKDLVDVIRYYNAKKIFQALRIVVNDELNAIEIALPKALSLLEENGRLAVISFHSLEDRIIKREFIDFQEKKLGKIITDKPIIPSEKEITENRRARSAKLRIFEKSVN